MNIAKQADVLKKALEVVVMAGGNLPDERLITRTGPNDAAHRGMMYVRCRDVAYRALAMVSERSPAWNYSTQEAINAEIMRKRDAGMVFDPITGEWYTQREVREIAE